jgi:hypothetical protein
VLVVTLLTTLVNAAAGCKEYTGVPRRQLAQFLSGGGSSSFEIWRAPGFPVNIAIAEGIAEVESSSNFPAVIAFMRNGRPSASYFVPVEGKCDILPSYRNSPSDGINLYAP